MSPQDTLWAFSNHFGNSWWLVCSAFALPAAFIMLLKMVINEPFSSLLVGRVFLMGGFLAFGVTPLNSGWLPIGAMLVSMGGLISAVLIATNWCSREDTSVSMPRAIYRWVMGHLHDRPLAQRARKG